MYDHYLTNMQDGTVPGYPVTQMERFYDKYRCEHNHTIISKHEGPKQEGTHQVVLAQSQVNELFNF